MCMTVSRTTFCINRILRRVARPAVAVVASRLRWGHSRTSQGWSVERCQRRRGRQGARMRCVTCARQQVAEPALAVAPARREALGTGQRRLSPGGQRRCRTVSWVPACTHSVDVGAQASPPVLARADFSTESQSHLQKAAGLPRCDCHGRRWDPRDADG